MPASLFLPLAAGQSFVLRANPALTHCSVKSAEFQRCPCLRPPAFPSYAVGAGVGAGFVACVAARSTITRAAK